MELKGEQNLTVPVDWKLHPSNDGKFLYYNDNSNKQL